MASDVAAPLLPENSNAAPTDAITINGERQNADSFMENGSLDTTETTINIKNASADPDPNPAGPTPVDDVSGGIQPVADFLPKDAPAHSHPTPPPDQPLVTGEADVDTEMANVDSEAQPPAEPESKIETEIAAPPPEQSLVRPREDDADADDERAAKRSKVEDESHPDPLHVKVATEDDGAAPLVPSSAAPEVKTEQAQTVAAPPTDEGAVTQVDGEPAARASESEPAAQPAAEEAKPSIEAQAAPPAAPAQAQTKHSTAPMTSHQKAYLVEKTKNLKKTKNSLPFLKPVDPVALGIPNYLEVIKNPMDLSTLDQKLKADQYGSVQDFVNDFELIIDNCRTFNGPNHVVTQSAMSLDAYFKKAMESVPNADQPPPQKAAAVKRSSPAVKTQPPRRESRTAAVATSPAAAAGETFALSADGMPQIRRDSTMNRPARAIKPPANREVTYAKPKRKEHQLELKFCEYVLKEIKGPKYAATNSVFQMPVDPVALNIPHYRQIVKHPMDLSTMAQKLNQGQYAKAGEVKKDFDLMVQNCLAFNPPGNPVRDMGIQLQRDFNSLWATKEKWERANKPESTRATSASADEESADEEDDDDEPEDDKQQTIEALQKQLAEMQNLMAGLVPGAKAPKAKKSSKTKSSKQKVPSAASVAPSRKIATSKPAKAKKPKQVTYEEKQEISEAVGNMNEQQVAKLTAIITENCQKYRDMEDMELEIDDLPNDVQLLLLEYVRKIFGRPKKAGASTARDTSDDDIAGQDDDDFKPRGNSSRADGKRKKHKPMGRSEQNQAIHNLKGKLAQFGQVGTSGSESPTNSSFNAAGAAAESSGDDESEESEEE